MRIAADYRIVPDIAYGTASNFETKLDLYLPRGREGPLPTLIQIHGGGWVGGSKEANALRFLPYLEMGWAVVRCPSRTSRWWKEPRHSRVVGSKRARRVVSVMATI